MISGEHAFIRTADPDDAAAMARLYQPGRVRAALQDSRHEPLLPNADELREALATPDALKGTFFAVEDRAGLVQGFCLLRGASKDAAYGEFSLLLIDPAGYSAPLADEVFRFAYGRAFELLGLRKLISHCFDSETEIRGYLLRNGFASNGIQREVFFGRGRWHNLETFSIFAPVLRAVN